jgi:hypothetical protein
MDALSVIKRFAAGEIPPAVFAERFYANLDEFEGLLRDDPDLPPQSYVGDSAFDFLLNLSFGDAFDVEEARGALLDFLQRRQEPAASSESADLYGVMLSAQPPWLDVIDHPWVRQTILLTRGSRTGDALREWLAGELATHFRIANRPPEWLQNPDWPIEESGPLVFLAQVSIAGYFHDEAIAYVFYSPVDGSCRTVLQFA